LLVKKDPFELGPGAADSISSSYQIKRISALIFLVSFQLPFHHRLMKTASDFMLTVACRQASMQAIAYS